MRTVDAMEPLTAVELLELWQTYRQRSDDPLERTLQSLIAANPQIKNPNLIYPGNEVKLP